MSLPTRTDLIGLDFVYQGRPFIQVEAKTIGTKSLDVVYQGMPFVTLPGAGPAPDGPPAVLFDATRMFLIF